jgi:hypothetical protein
MQRALIAFGILSLALIGAAAETAAEVSVKTDINGDYVSTVIVPGGSHANPGIWSGRARGGLRLTASVLNPNGDRIGDLIPAVAESNQPPHHPWAVWSRFNGSDYDLVWSSWSQAWQGISPVVQDNPAGDDLNPEIGFMRDGRPIVAWWNRNVEDGHGTVYVAVFLAGAWTEPMQVSSDKYGGRLPSIETNLRGQIVVNYTSDDGTRNFSYRVMVSNPNTITDDIDPQSFIWLSNANMSFSTKKPYDSK